MKQLLFALLMFPLLASAQSDKKMSDFQGVQMSDCIKYSVKELARGEKGVLTQATAGRVTPQTKTIYIARQTWLKDMPESYNGITLKYVDIDSNIQAIAEDVQNNKAAVFLVGNFEPKSNMSELWVFPIELKKVKKKYEKEFLPTAYKMHFFFAYDPPSYEYRGTDAVAL